MLSVLIVPVIKDKAGNINSKYNYRLIALASINSKIVQNIHTGVYGNILTTQHNQFGFKKKKLGTGQCTYYSI